MFKKIVGLLTHTTTLAAVCAVALGFLAGNYYAGRHSADNATGNPHAQHQLLAEQAQNGIQSSPIPGLSGDRNKRYTVSFNHPEDVAADTDVPVSFDVYDALTGSPAAGFQEVYTKQVHMVIVNDSLTYFKHLHPDVSGNRFSILLNLPADRYHIYLTFQPAGAIEQQVGQSLAVGGAGHTPAAQPPDTNLTKTVDGYHITLSSGAYSASQLSVGQQKMRFSFKDASGKPVTNLKPYLGAFGHLTMVNEQTYDFVHVHPASVTSPPPDANGGPAVEFLPLGLYGPIKPGTYRVFAEFSPAGNLTTTDFTVIIK